MQGKNGLKDQMVFVQKYVACIKENVDVWQRYFSTSQFDWLAKSQVNAWFDRIRTTMTVLGYRYSCEMKDSMDVTVVSSGLPKPYDVRIMEYESAQSAESGKAESASAKDLKRMFVDEICRKKAVNYAFLDLFGKAYASEIMAKSDILRLFRIVDMREVKSENGSKAYVCCWERYNNQSIPSLYGMLFEYHDATDLNADIVSELSLVLREDTSIMPSLATLGQQIDQAVAVIRPKWIGRMSFGPVFISHLTQDEIELQKIIDHVADGDEMVSASRVIYEYVISEGEDDARGLRDPQGRKQQVLQRFSARCGDDECYVRGVTHVQKLLHAPHAVVQLMDPEYRQLVNHEIIGSGEYGTRCD